MKLQSTKLPHSDTYIHVGDVLQYKDEPQETVVNIEQRKHGDVVVRTTDNSESPLIPYSAADLGLAFENQLMTKVYDVQTEDTL